MRKTGRETQNLTARLQEKTQRQRSDLTELMETELQKLANGLRQSSRAALSGLENDIQTQMSALQQNVRSRKAAIESDLGEIRERPKLWITISAATAALITTLFWAGPTLWMMWRLNGVTVETNKTGTFLILPETAELGWRCGERPCAKLED